MEKPLIVQTNLNGFALKVSDQILDETQRFFIERKSFQVSSYKPSDDYRVRPQTNLFSGRRLGAQQEPKVSKMRQPFLHQPEPAHSEVSRCNVQRPTKMFRQQVLQDVSQYVGLVIYYIGKFHIPAV